MNERPRLKRYAITGGIGAGKSTAVKIFNELGIPSVDADAIARKLREPGQAAHSAILKRFGTDDRNLLRQKLSHDPEAKKDLEAILHPLIHQASEAEMKKIEQIEAAKPEPEQAPFLLYEAALIIEAGRAKDFDGLMVVTAPVSAKIERIKSRDGVSEDAAKAMILAQLSDEDRIPHAQFIIKNEGSSDELRQSIRNLLDQLKRP